MGNVSEENIDTNARRRRSGDSNLPVVWEESQELFYPRFFIIEEMEPIAYALILRNSTELQFFKSVFRILVYFYCTARK